MTIATWMPVLKTKLEEIDGILHVYTYDDIAATILETPVFLVMPTAGNVEYSAGGPNNTYHELQITLLTASQILPEAMGVAVPYIDLVKKKLAANRTLDNTVDNIVPTQRGDWYDGPGGIRYADKMHTGIIFRYAVKEQESFTVSA